MQIALAIFFKSQEKNGTLVKRRRHQTTKFSDGKKRREKMGRNSKTFLWKNLKRDKKSLQPADLKTKEIKRGKRLTSPRLSILERVGCEEYKKI